MKHSFTLLLSALALQVSAQTAPSWTSAASLPITPFFRAAPSFATDAAGNTYLAASFAQSVTLAPGTVLTSQSLQDGVVAKYGPTGNLLWYRQLSGDGNESFQKVIVNASGKVLLLGLASDGAKFGTATFSTTNFSSSLVLTQLDDQGQVQYLREVGSADLLIPASLATDAAGNCYVSGSFGLQATFGNFSLTTPISLTGYGFDQFVVKVSAAGTVEWAQQGGREQITGTVGVATSLSHLVAAPSGGVYLVWSCSPAAGGFGSLSLPAGKGDYDGLVLKFDAQGSPQWVQRLGGTGADLLTYAGLDAGGRLVVPGITAPTGTLASPSAVSATIATNGFVSVLEPATGAPVWSQELQAAQAGGYRSVAADATGNIYLAGHFGGQGTVSGKTLTGAGGIDALVVSYSANGTLRWTQQSGGTGDEVPTHIALDGTGHAVIAGLLTNSGLFGNTALMSTATVSATGAPFVAYLGSTGTVTATRAGQAAAPLACYPNPASATAAVTLPTLPAGTQLTLLDALGHVVRQQPATPTLPLADLVPGLYQVQAVAPSGEQWASRLVVE